MYAVVEFEIDNSISPVQKSWISADQKTCYYPPISQFKKIILKATMPDTNRWTLFNIVIKGEFDTLQSAITYSKYLSEVENTDNEQILKQKKIEKRKHPVKSLETNFDLSKKLKKMKTEIDDSTFSHSSILANFKIQKVEKSNDSNLDVSQNVQIEEEHLEEENLEDNLEGENLEEENLEELHYTQQNYEDNSLSYKLSNSKQHNNMKNYFESAFNSFKDDIYRFIEYKFEALEAKLGIDSTEIFVKIKNKLELDEFKHKLEQNPTFKSKMIATLKSLAVAGRHHSILNGKISTFLEYLFENSFLPSLRWSDVPGKSTEERIKLVDYSSVIGLFKSAASENVDGVIQFPENQKVKQAIQNYFKQSSQKKNSTFRSP